MDWLSRIQQNSQVFMNNGLLRPDTVSKLEQYAQQQKQKVAQAGGLAPLPQRDKQEDSEAMKTAQSIGANVGGKIKELMKTPEQMTPTPSANLIQTEGGYSPEFMTALSNFMNMG